jgi:hypothetical protein
VNTNGSSVAYPEQLRHGDLIRIGGVNRPVQIVSRGFVPGSDYGYRALFGLDVDAPDGPVEIEVDLDTEMRRAVPPEEAERRTIRRLEQIMEVR